MEENIHLLQRWRLDRGFERIDVAKRIDCTRQTVARYEGGRMPEQPFLDRIVVMTDGEVDANAWLGKEAADVVSKRSRV